ncbi:MAG TPA: serine/threonine-protein kinase, partial [Gemmataceae bacterium]|nr:serine/threonine-protein kinase [Gemmataceae bacterium]
MPGQHRLLAQVGAGPDGVAYRGLAPDGATAVEVRVLGRAWEDAGRREALTRRLRRALLLRHPAAAEVRELGLEEAPPYLALEWVEGPDLEKWLAGRLPLPAGEALELTRALAEVLAEAHRLGLAHGALRPGSVRLAGGVGLKLDFTGTRVGGASDAPEGPSTPEADAAALGALLGWLLTGRPAAEFAPGAELPEGLSGVAAELLRGLLVREPGERRTARAAADRLRALHLSAQATHCVDGDAPADGGPAAAPERLGRFRLLEKLGEGGMGAVYRAEDGSDGSVVAVKVLRGSSASSQAAALRRFHKEARLLAELSSPYVTNLLEVNEDGGTQYLVLEYVEGMNLEQLVRRRGRLAEREALAVVADAARGLAEAHAAGVVHRDVKPENVLLPAGGGEVRAKLSDFGLARHVVESESLNLTRAGAVLGTPLYMSPEQCAGATLDARSDVYSLGATLYHALAGRPPFSADSLLALLAMHARQAPPPLRKLDPPVSD